MEQTAIKINNVSKEYRLGAIGGGTLRGDLQSWWAKVRGKEDPNMMIGQKAPMNERFLALKDINLEIKQGERIGIIGHNGAGKSTLLKLLSRVTLPSSGEIAYNGRISSMLEVGTGFHPELTGRENVYLNGSILGMTKKEIDQKFDQIVEFAELSQFIDTPVKRYSSGMYVKLAFSVAAHLDSDIVIMDEVLAVGDMQFQQKCLNKMVDLSEDENRTILYVSHNMNTIKQLCDRIIVLSKGEVIYVGNVDEGIQKYLGVGSYFSTKYEYEEQHHAHYMDKERFEITSLELLDRENNIVLPEEKVDLKINMRAGIDLKNIYLRFEIQHNSIDPTASSFLAEAIDIVAGENKEIKATFCPKGLMPSEYRIDIVAFQTNELGQEFRLDGIHPAFHIQLEDVIDSREKVIWNHDYWGHIQLEKVRLSDL